MTDDLAKAKILLAWATRVYGPDEEADEYNRFLEMGCKIAGIEFETLGRVSMDELLATSDRGSRGRASRAGAAETRTAADAA